jgi:pre-rRNA-processing protein TSR3
MNSFPNTLILRHRKENLNKCSLRGLEERQDLSFYSYPKDDLHPPQSYITLSFDGPALSKEDCHRGIFLLDGTWRYAETMAKKHSLHLENRSLPKGIQTAYPRKQDDCSEPARGLASVEALFAAFHILGRNTEGLLDNYYFKDLFLKRNKKLFSTWT